jgi:hypothetical protein
MTFFIILDHRQPITNDEPQLTDDEDNSGRDVSPPEQDLIEIEQQKKRRRTANYQHVISTTTTNGNHEDERTPIPLSKFNYFRFYQILIIILYSNNSFDEQCSIVIKSSNNR